MEKYYVYGHFDNNGNCHYIGKGSVNRAWTYCQRSKRWREIFSNSKPVVKIFKNRLTEKEAYEIEAHLISEHIKKGHDLINIAIGGYGKDCFDGRSKKIFSDMRKGDKTWTYGKKRPESTRKLISETKRKNPDKSISKYWLGKKRDPLLIKKMCEASQSEESKIKRYGTRIGVKLSEEHRKKIYDSSNKKPIFCSNGIKYESINDAARSLGLSCGRISEVANGIRNSAKGLKFSFGEI